MLPSMTKNRLFSKCEVRELRECEDHRHTMAHHLRLAAWQLETTALLKPGCWVASRKGGNGVGVSVKVEATSMRLCCKWICPPPHFLLTQKLNSFLDQIYRDQGSSPVLLALFFGRVDTTHTARVDVVGCQLGYLTFYHYIYSFRNWTLNTMFKLWSKSAYKKTNPFTIYGKKSK